MSNQLDFNQLNDAFRSSQYDKVFSAIGSTPIKSIEIAKKFLSALRHSGALVIEIQNNKKEANRDNMVAKCREILTAVEDSGTITDFENHVEDARLVEYGFREIFKSIRKSEIWQRPPAEQVWAIISCAEINYNELRKGVDDLVQDMTKGRNPILNPNKVALKDSFGNPVSPDGAIHGITRNVGDSFVTLAYSHDWFDKASGELVIPAAVNFDHKVTEEAFLYSVMASQWRALENAWDRSRFFGTRLRLQRKALSDEDNHAKEYSALQAQVPTFYEKLDQTALSRLEQAFIQHQMDLEYGGEVLHGVGIKQEGQPTPLAKTGYLSMEERLSAEILEAHFCLPIDDSSKLILGLSLKVWLRGYACLSQLSKDPDANGNIKCLPITRNDLLLKLISCGLTEDQSKLFIKHTTFGRNAADLFDAPLIMLNDGSFLLFTIAYQTPTLGTILLSRIASLNRRRDSTGEAANDCKFEDKGKAFENCILDVFKKSGILSAGFKYKIDDVEYDCDAVALIDDTLFVFDCKNYSLPMGHVPSLYYFLQELKKHREQVRRIASQLDANPQFVTIRLGDHAIWKKTVPVVLYSLPWSAGYSGGVYCYDASALRKICCDGYISISIIDPTDSRKKPLFKHRLRKGARLTAVELEQEMKLPAQVKLHLAGWKTICKNIQVSDELVFMLPDLADHPMEVEEQLRLLGIDPETVKASIEIRTGKAIHIVDQALQDVFSAETGTHKIRRNDLCFCKSGKKYKHCCG